MAKKRVNSVTSNPIVEFHRLFGPALVFKTEDLAIYKAILEGLAEDEKPRNMIERILIRDIADLVYQRLWLRSLGPRLIACAHTRDMRGSASLSARIAAINHNGIVGRKLERPNQQSCFSANELTLALEALVGGELRPAIRLLKRQTRALRAAIAIARVTNANAKSRATEYNQADRKESSPPPASCPDRSTQRSDEDQPATQVRDEVDAFQHALPELLTLVRYERRTLSRRKRAIRMFEAIAIFAAFLDRKTKAT